MTTFSSAIARRELLIGTGAGLALAATPGIVTAAGVPGLEEAIATLATANGFNGIVRIGKAGTVIHTQMFGFADIEAKRAFRPDDIFGIASISKWLTALTVLRLVERGALALDAPITRWLPHYRADTGARLSLRRLLSNSSGLPATFIPALKLDASLLTKDMPADEAVRRFASGDLYFEPGSRFDYILENWILVFAIIEAVTGLPYLEAMRRLTLAPLGLRSTGADASIAQNPRTVPSYRSISPVERRVYQRQPFLVAAGGFFSDPHDLLLAAHRVYDGGFLSAASRNELLTVIMAADDYALGGRVKKLRLGGEDRTIAWETGNTAGYRSVVAHRLDKRQTVIILNNSSMSQRVLDDFAKAIFARL
jgi:CubicO group peptidase (beta-lactamase class C family)